MSIYSVLAFDPPIMAYATFHQARKGIEPAEYTKTMLDLHRLLQEHTRMAENSRKESLATMLSHVATKLRRALSPYLTTPLKSDEDDIERTVKEELRDVLRVVEGDFPVGMIGSTEALVITDAKEIAPKSLVTRSKAYLRDLGFQVGASSPPIFTSQFIVQGGENLDVLEHLVRDRIGIYTDTHGKHIREFEGYSYALYNLVGMHGALPRSSEAYEGILFFSKGEPHYQPFRNAMTEWMEQLVNRYNLPHASLWQRKLGLGVGKEFVLRIRASNAHQVADALSDAPFKQKSFVTDALKKGHPVITKFLS